MCACLCERMESRRRNARGNVRCPCIMWEPIAMMRERERERERERQKGNERDREGARVRERERKREGE